MIGEPMIHPRELMTVELEKHKQQFLAAGNVIQNIPTGLSGYSAEGHSQHRYRLERAKLAPALQAYADAGTTLQFAAMAMKIKSERAKLIAKENGIVFRLA